MRNTLTREELIKAQNAFSCKSWVNPIQEILDSTNEKEILIQDKYLDLIKECATWKQIILCKALNLDLKMNIPKEAKVFVLKKMKSCEIVKYDEFETHYQENGKNIFLLNSKFKKFWVNYFQIGVVLEEKHSLKLNEMRELMNTVLEEHLKLKGYEPLY